jgi:asparagine synthase (glutamine-hydrolysing)
MCGIAGYVGPAGPDLLPTMLRLLKHRGPDDAGFHEADGAGLGTTRLAIIDLAGGRQPMRSDDGRLWVAFNGEIYNHRELHADLEARGHRVRTRSDTEAILRGFEADGEASVERLRGMFAIAVWDAHRRRLVLVRDRLGKKPLYYRHRDGLLLFASEPKALLCHPAVSRLVDHEALHHYLAFGYTPAARSIFAEIEKVEPGHAAVLEADRLVLRRYWALPPGDAPAPAARDPRELPARVRGLVGEAVRLRLESDVPLGVFLSGGIDSSVIVAAMRELTAGPIATFTIGFGAAPDYDERPVARAVARRFETTHHEEVLEPRVADLLPALVEAFDEPFADSSAVPTFVVAQATARHLKVALSGIGGDETFGGYPRYLGVRLSERYRRLPAGVRSLAAAAGRLLPDSERSRNWGDRLRRFTAGAALPMPARYVGWTRFFREADLAGLATPALRSRWTGDVEAAQAAAYAGRRPGDPVDGAMRIDLATYLPDDLLVMADRMSMAHSLELRAPFCDHRLIEACLAIPTAVKLPGWRLKGLLRDAFAPVLPPEVLAHRKQGFMIPLARWLRTDLAPVVDDCLAPAVVAARGLFDPAAVAALVAEHRQGRRSHADRLWALLMMELWLRLHMDRGTSWRLP